MVQINNLMKSYKGFKVLDGLTMSINKGDVYGFLGKNGCGKTTTMNIICDIIPKDDGEIILGDGENPIKIGYLPETPALFDYMNGYEYLEYIAGCAKYKGDVKKRIAEVLEITGMTEGGRRRIKGYSRGMNQRLGIAATIFTNPDLVILDEPTSALDPEGRAEVMAIINNLTRTGCTILLCTHILSDVERVANRIGIMRGGRLAAEGSISEILDKYRINTIEFAAAEPSEQTESLLRSAAFTKNVSFYTQSGLYVIEVEDEDRGMAELVRLIADNNIPVRSLRASRPTLEQVYLDLVSGN
ncbi:MAG: ATP-binding cassette domain-containing protein [Ruminiclostridium sp.]